MIQVMREEYGQVRWDVRRKQNICDVDMGRGKNYNRKIKV